MGAFSFPLFQERVHKAVNEADYEALGKLQSDEQRVRFVATLLAGKGVHLPPPPPHASPKDAPLALQRRNQGNHAFQNQDYNTAQQLYTLSLQLAQDQESICVALANRSAALYHMKQYQLVLDDLQELHRVGAYPKNLQYKVAERKARCFLALEQRISARDAFRETLVALDDAKLDAERKQKWRTDVQIMLVMLSKGDLRNAAAPAAAPSATPALSGGANRLFPSASAALQFEYGGAERGRQARCGAALRPGAALLVEAPITASLLPQRRATHCWHCLRRLQTALPCATCAEVLFCGAACRDAAGAAHHRFECAFLPALRLSSASITCQIALRLAANSTPDQLRKAMKEASERDASVIGDEKYDPQSLVNFFNLVSHRERRTPRDLLQRTLMALFLLHGLGRSDYFGAPMLADANELSADQVTVGAALLLALQITQFNSHEVSELVSQDNGEDESVFIGGAVYPTLALLNHSCHPSVTRYFAAGGVVVVRAVRLLQPGDDVSENYGQLWTRESRSSRQQRLREQYWFDCACDACEDDWPLFEHIPEDAVRLRCGACGAAVASADLNQIVATCLVCGHKTSVLASLAGVADTERKMQMAKLRAVDKPAEAMDMFIQILEALDKFLAPPPCKDYVLCQQALRKCLLQMGNWHKGHH